VASYSANVAEAIGLDYPTVVLADSPLAYWKLDETSGTVIADSSGNGRNLTVLSATNLTLGVASPLGSGGKGVRFNGLASGSTIGSSTALIPVTGDLTLECWCTYEKGGPGNFNGMVNLATTAANNGRIIQIDNIGNTNAGRPRFRIDPSTGGSYTPSPLPTVEANDNRLHHMVLTYVASSGLATLYMDSVSIGTRTVVGALDTAFYVALGWGPGTGNQIAWKGFLDEVAIYGSALTATQIKTHYTAGTQGGIAKVGVALNGFVADLANTGNLLPANVSTGIGWQHSGAGSGVLTTGQNDPNGRPYADSASYTAAVQEGYTPSSWPVSVPEGSQVTFGAWVKATSARQLNLSIEQYLDQGNYKTGSYPVINLTTAWQWFTTTIASTTYRKLRPWFYQLSQNYPGVDVQWYGAVLVQGDATKAAAVALFDDATTRALLTARGPADTAAATDAPARTYTAPRGAAESAPAADALTRGIAILRYLADTATATDTPTRIAALQFALAETAAALDTLARTYTAPRGAAESAPAADAYALARRYLRYPADATTVVDTLTALLHLAARIRFDITRARAELGFQAAAPELAFATGDPELAFAVGSVTDKEPTRWT